MTDGIKTDGFAQTKPGATNSIDAGYASNPGSAFPATDKSTQDGAGLGNNGK